MSDAGADVTAPREVSAPVAAPLALALIGTGGVGRNVTRLVRGRPQYRLAAAYSRNPTHQRQDIGSLAGGGPLGVTVSGDRNSVLEAGADVLLVATTSFLSEVADHIEAGLAAGMDVLTTAEEAAFPWILDEALATRLHQAALAAGRSVLGAGLNPGFIFDTLLLTASAIAWDVRSIAIRRVVDVSGFSATVQQRLGIGFTADEFAGGVAEERITGHIGFPQSFHLAAASMGKSIQRIDKAFEPLLAAENLAGASLTVRAGTTGGFVQRYTAYCDDAPWMSAEFVAHVAPGSVGCRTTDEITIDGYNGLHLTLDPGCQPQLGTAAMLANVMPRLREAPAGFITVADLRIPHARPSSATFD